MHPTRALILGGGESVWQDHAAVVRLFGQAWDGLIIAVNDAAAHWDGPLHHWVSLHPKYFDAWAAAGRSVLHGVPRWGPSRDDAALLPAVQTLPALAPSGSSGLFAVQVARALGCTKIILCGVPMTVTPHFIESAKHPRTGRRERDGWQEADRFWPAWAAQRDALAPFVRSLGGRTRELFGVPTPEWLHADAPALKDPAQSWAVCLGGARGVWDDLLAWEAMYGRPWDGLVVCCNDVGAHWPRQMHHWCTLHPEKFAAWEALRRQQNLPLRYETWSRIQRPRNAVAVHHAIQPWGGGSSGMLAVQVAVELGCTRVVMCGIPMDDGPHFTESAEFSLKQHWKAVAGHWKAWVRGTARMLGRVRSMSGRTRELLGAPTIAWLREES